MRTDAEKFSALRAWWYDMGGFDGEAIDGAELVQEVAFLMAEPDVPDDAQWWTSSLGTVELRIGLDDAVSCSHPGQCDDDVARLILEPYIAQQLAELAPGVVRAAVREMMADIDDEELADEKANLHRLLWIACCEIADEGMQ